MLLLLTCSEPRHACTSLPSLPRGVLWVALHPLLNCKVVCVVFTWLRFARALMSRPHRFVSPHTPPPSLTPCIQLVAECACVTVQGTFIFVPPPPLD